MRKTVPFGLMAVFALMVGCGPKLPPTPKQSTRVEMPATYQPITLTDLSRPLPPSPMPCEVGTRQAGPVITELVTCGDRAVSRVMVLPAEAPPPLEMLAMAQRALQREDQVLEIQAIDFPANGRTLIGHRIFRTSAPEREFAALAVVHPEAPWPELLTCSSPAPVVGLETWCAAAIQALVLPDDLGRMSEPPAP
jgi:hypothetical protein